MAYNFLTLKPEIFGLHLTDHSLRILQIKKQGRRIWLQGAKSQKLEPGLISQGQIKDLKAVAEHIKQAVASSQPGKINTPYVAVAVSEQSAFIETIKLPQLQPQEVTAAAQYEAENYIPLPLEQVYLSSQALQPLANHLDHTDALLVALPKSNVDSYVATLKTANLIPVLVVPESLAVTRAVLPRQQADHPVLIVLVDEHQTLVIIFSGTAIRFSAINKLSLELLGQRIARHLKIPLPKATQLLERFGLQGQSKVTLKGSSSWLGPVITFEKYTLPDPRMHEAVGQVLLEFKEQIQKYIAYWRSHASHEHLPQNHKPEQGIDRVLLAGPGANIKGFDDFLRQELMLPVAIANPFVNLLAAGHKTLAPLSLPEAQQYVVAIGLTMMAMEKK